MSIENAREHIQALVEQIVEDKQLANADFHKGDRIQYGGHIYDADEVGNIIDCALGYWYAEGKFGVSFSQQLAEYLGVKHCFLVNSGSSANLLAFMTLTSRQLGDMAIARGDEVITVASGFPTTVAPIIQFGAVPCFVDVTIPQYNIDVEMLEQALSPRTKAVFIAHTLGNPFDLERVVNFCKKHDLWLIEDNCDSLGSTYQLNGKKQMTGTFGDIATSSFYPAHHISMGEGGAVYTNNDQLAKIARSMRNWGRDCVCQPGHDNCCGKRFEGSFGNMPFGYDHKYIYSEFGYNLKLTDLQAAIGCAQIKKLPGFVQTRKANHQYLTKKLKNLETHLILPQPCKNADPSWFGYLLTCKQSNQRNNIVAFLESKNVQTRMLFGGNITKQPCISNHYTRDVDYRVIGTLDQSDRIMNDTFWVGVYPGLTQPKLDYMVELLYEYFSDK